VLYGHQFRARSPENVSPKSSRPSGGYGHDEIYFDDDTFTSTAQRVLDICHLIRERGLEEEVEWIAAVPLDNGRPRGYWRR